MATKFARPPLPAAAQVHSPERLVKYAEVINAASARFSGVIDELESAIGMLMLGDYFGWKVLVLVHNKRTIRKYEDILGIKVREFFPEEGPIAMRSVGYDLALKLGNFWKAVSGDVAVEGRREILKG